MSRRKGPDQELQASVLVSIWSPTHCKASGKSLHLSGPDQKPTSWDSDYTYVKLVDIFPQITDGMFTFSRLLKICVLF